MLRAVVGAPFSVLSALPLRIASDHDAPVLATPPGVLLGLLFTDTIAEEDGVVSVDSDAGVAHVGAACGKGLLVYRPDAVSSVRIRPRRPLDLIQLTLVPRNEALLSSVLWAGINLWPVDPFEFSVDGFRMYPDHRPYVVHRQTVFH